MPSSSSSILPPRLLSRAIRALPPSLLGSGSLMLLLPLAQIINAAPDDEERPIVLTHHAPPPLVEPPEPPDTPDEPDEPIEPPDETPELPDPFMLVVPPNLGGVDHYADAKRWSGFDKDTFIDEIEDWANLTVAPVPLSQVDPRYPPELRSAGIEGDVRVKFLIRANGSVSRITLLTSTHRRFSEEAERAVRKWKFQPGEKQGHAVAVWALQTIPFRIH